VTKMPPITGRLYLITDGRKTYVACRGLVMWRLLTARPFNPHPFLQDEDVTDYVAIDDPPWAGRSTQEHAVRLLRELCGTTAEPVKDL